MTSKEQLIYYKQQCEEQANYIIELKERLETLEIENEQLKGNETIICDYAYSLKQENETLNKALDIAKEDYTTTRINLDNASARIKDLEQENEKLKKAIKLLKYLFDMDFELCSTTDKESVYLLSGDCYMRISSESVDVDLLKEVLGNDKD